MVKEVVMDYANLGDEMPRFDLNWYGRVAWCFQHPDVLRLSIVFLKFGHDE